jgi:glycosyltransferase involved in cell wall biosynthesis
MSSNKKRRVLIVVQNLPVPFDRRVWLEATSLAANGYAVSVISPKMKGYNASFEQLEGVNIYRYPMPLDPSTKVGFISEIALGFIRTFGKSVRVAILGRGFDVIHACNPPETYWLLGMFWKMFGKKFIFDHHDLSPELFVVKFNGTKGFFHKLLLRFERLSYQTSDAAISTNESYKTIAVERGGMERDRVFVVRSGPDVNRFNRHEPDLSLKQGKRYLIAYLGEISTQDGVDGFVRIAKILRDDLGRDDFHCLVIGGGEQQPSVVEYADQVGVGELFTFTGDVRDDDRLCRLLSSADIGLDPVPVNEWSDRSTSNKIVEYMYFGLPVVSYDLHEAKQSAGPAGVFAIPGSEQDFARVISELLDDEPARQEMARVGVDRLENQLSWEHSVPVLLDAYRTALGD